MDPDQTEFVFFFSFVVRLHPIWYIFELFFESYTQSRPNQRRTKIRVVLFSPSAGHTRQSYASKCGKREEKAPHRLVVGRNTPQFTWNDLFIVENTHIENRENDFVRMFVNMSNAYNVHNTYTKWGSMAINNALVFIFVCGYFPSHEISATDASSISRK